MQTQLIAFQAEITSIAASIRHRVSGTLPRLALPFWLYARAHATNVALVTLSLAGCLLLSGQTYDITTFAGGLNNLGATAYYTVNAVAIDNAGNVFIALPNVHFVARLDRAGSLMRVAGNGTAGYAGDGGTAIGAELSYPSGLAIDSAGNLFIADIGSNVVRKVSPDGVITTFAGTGETGFAGDGGPATSARLFNPTSVAMDSAGNLFITDTQNQRIRKVSTDGIITTVAGSGTRGFTGDGGPATDARLFGPVGVAVDSAGNLYIADTYNSAIRKVSGGVIETIAGIGGAGPAHDGPAANAALAVPGGIFVDAAGTIWIADTGHQSVRKIFNGIITTIAGAGTAGFSGDNGPATAAQLNSPSGVAVDANGNIYIADSRNFRLRVVSNGIITTLVRSGGSGFGGDGGPPASAELSGPSGVAMDSSGNLYIADDFNNRVRMVSNGSITTVVGTGAAGYSGDGGSAVNANLNAPAAVAVDGAGNLYISDTGNNAVRKVTRGVISTVTSGNPAFPAGDAMAADAAGNLYIGINFQCTSKIPPGIFSTTSVGVIAKLSHSVATYLSPPSCYDALGPIGGLATDSSGTLFIATGSKVAKLSNGQFSTVAGTGLAGFSGDNGPATSAQLSSPQGLFIDSAGAIWIADTGNQRIRKVVNGVISTVAGTGTASIGGDGGAALTALLNNPRGLVVDQSGEAYVADTGNSRIRALIPSNACATSVTLSSYQVGASGGNLTATIQAGASCAWMVSGLPAWIGVAEGTSGSGPATVTVAVAANAGAARTATIGIAGQNITIAQAAPTYTVSGHITLDGQPLSGVKVSLYAPAAINPLYTFTDSMGFYSMSYPATGVEFGVDASLSGYSFAPQSYRGLGFSTKPDADFIAFANPKIARVGAGFASSSQPAPTSFAPGEIISIYGTDLCDEPQTASPPLPNQLASCNAVFVNSFFPGSALALYYASPGQLNAILPQTVTRGQYSVTVNRRYPGGGGISAPGNPFPITVAPVSMAFVERVENGSTLLAAQYADGGFAGPKRPLTPGDVITLYLTGLGAKTQIFSEGTAPGATAAAIAAVQILVQGIPAAVLYAGVQPEYPGLDQIVLRLPTYSLPGGRHTATMEIAAPSVQQTVRYELDSN